MGFSVPLCLCGSSIFPSMSDPYESWREEKQSAWLYRVVADCERGTPRAALFDELAQAADEQADIWLNAIIQKGSPPPAPFQGSRLMSRSVLARGCAA